MPPSAILMVMRTTLIVDDDVLKAANRIAEARGTSVDTVISDLARRGLALATSGTTRNGIRLFPVREGAGPVTPDIVRRLLDESA